MTSSREVDEGESDIFLSAPNLVLHLKSSPSVRRRGLSPLAKERGGAVEERGGARQVRVKEGGVLHVR